MAEIEVKNGRSISHLTADKIKIQRGTQIITLDLSPDGIFLSTADSHDSTKMLAIQPVHTNKIKIL